MSSPTKPVRDLSWESSRTRHFKRKDVHPHQQDVMNEGAGTGHDAAQDEKKIGNGGSGSTPQYDAEGHLINTNGHRVTKGIQPDGESGRRGFHPLWFLRVCWASSCTASKWTNVLWPFTVAAMVLHFGFHNLHVWIFVCSYVGMVPAANLVGFAGQELARKMPKVAGVMLETTFGSLVEIILFVALLVQGGNENTPVIRAAILGSILANLLFSLGLCFFVGGIFHPQQTFHEAVSEVGSNLMLVAGVGLVIPTIYYNSLSGRPDVDIIAIESLKISRAAAIILLAAFLVYVWFQARSHHGLYEDILEADEERDHDRHRDLAKPKLTLTESIVAIVLALTLVTFMAVFLVQQIHYLKGQRVSDAFLGLILVPLVEKASEHLTAVDEAYDNQMNFALSHVLGASIQTALLNAPLIVLIAWGLGYDGMSLNFEMFDAVVLILAIIVVGNFLRDEKSDYLEGALCVFVYLLIAVTAYYYPDPAEGGTASAETGAEVGEAAAAVVHEMVRRL